MNDRINGQMTSPMKRILVLISGSGSNLQAILDGCAGGKIAGQVVGVISNRADAYGLVRAREAGVATAILAQQQFASREEYDAALLALMAAAFWQNDADFLLGRYETFEARLLDPGLPQARRGRPHYFPTFQRPNGERVHVAMGQLATELPTVGDPVTLRCSTQSRAAGRARVRRSTRRSRATRAVSLRWGPA